MTTTFRGTLDYIWFSPDSMRVSNIIDMPYHAQESRDPEQVCDCKCAKLAAQLMPQMHVAG